MREKYTQAYIYDLLEKARKVDSEYKVFGSDRHKYQLNPPISMEEVLKLEADFNIKLPEDYVHFLTEIGNGGAGPYYGLYSLEELRKHQYCIHQDSNLTPVIDINLSKEMWNNLMEQMDTDDDLYDEIEQHINTGIFIIGTQGCTYDNLLMCKGSESGNIVYIDWNLDAEYPPFLTKMSFWDWYIGFFQDIVNGYDVRSYGCRKRGTEQELIEGYYNSITTKDKLVNIDGLMRYDKLSVQTIDFLYQIKDVEIDSARLNVLLKYHIELGMKLFDKFIYGENISAAVSVIRNIPKEFQVRYYKRAIEILYEAGDCAKDTLLFFIQDQQCKKASDIIEFVKNLEEDIYLKSIAIYVLGSCDDSMNYESCFIEWMRGDDYKIAHTALQAAISMNHHSYALMETFRWMGDKYKTDSVMRSNLKKVL